MGRSTVYNKIVEDKYPLTNKENQDLLIEWMEYLHSIDRSQKTIEGYESDFKIWCVWCMENAKDKYFVDITKRDVMRFQGYCLNTLGHSPARVRRLRSSISSLSNYIENILDDEYPNFRNIINKIEAPTLEPVREKLVLDEEDVQDLLDKLVEQKKYQQACYLALAGYSGARKSELLRFKVDYFKEEYIENGLYATPEKIKTKGRGKMGKPLIKWTIAKFFDPYLKLWLDERERLGIDSEWLFVTRKDDEYSQAKVSTADSWAQTITRFLGQPFYAHSQRHYYTTMLHKAGIPTEIIKGIVGWSSVEMVSIYTDIEASDEFGKYFGEDGIKQQEKKSLNDL